MMDREMMCFQIEMLTNYNREFLENLSDEELKELYREKVEKIDEV